MPQKIWIGVVVASLVTFLTGLGVGRVSTERLSEKARTAEEELSLTIEDRDGIRAENEDLNARLEELQRKHANLGEALEEAHGKLAGRVSEVPVQEDETAIEAGDETGIDWKALAGTVHGFREVAFTICDLIADGGGSRSLSPELAAQRMDVIGQLNRAAAQARLHTGYPMLDEEMLPHIMDVYLGGLLDLTDEQVVQVQELALDLLAEHELASDATPLSAFPVRAALMEGVEQGLQSILTSNQQDDFRKLEPIWGEMKTGSVRYASMGVDAPDLQGRLTREWREHYRLDENQEREANRVAREYVQAARYLLERHGLLEPGATPNQEMRARVDRELYDLQRRFEENLVAHLSPEQRRDMQAQAALLIRFRPGAGVSLRSDDAVGF